MKTVSVGGVPFVVSSIDSCAKWILDRAELEAPTAIRFANAWCVVSANDSPSYMALLTRDGWNFPDGTPVALAMKFTGDASSRRVRGPSTFEHALDLSQNRQVRHFLLGATTETLVNLVDVISEKYPGASIVGSWAPPFGPLEGQIADEALSRIVEVRANMVWIGMGSPRQDFAASWIAESAGITVAGVGAAFDFLAGTVPEAPKFLSSIGFEWLFRLVSEPRRLWRRYLIGNFRFVMIVTFAKSRSRVNITRLSR